MKAKKWMCAALALCAALCLAACGKTPAAATAFAEGTTINGTDVSGLTPEEAAQALAERTEGYTFSLVMGDKTYTATGEELALTYNGSADLQALLDQQNADNTQLAFTEEGLYSADVTALRSRIELDFATGTEQPVPAPTVEEDAGETEGETTPVVVAAENSSAPKNAYLKYDESAKAYVIVPDENGLVVDCDAVVEQAQAAVEALERELKIDMGQFVVQAELTADSPEMQEALKDANSYLDLQLSYTFTPDGGSTSTETLTREFLASIYYLDDADMTMKVDEEILGNYVSTLTEKYSVAGKTTQFKTTGGSYIDISVATAGQSVDSEGLYNDMLKCLQDKTGGKRAAPYEKSSDSGKGFWGGNYVEIDQTSQKLWLYKNGECIFSTDIVSGNVANNTRTPNGCFKIFAMNKDRYLQGYNTDGSRYKTWVSYFMPFSGGCGIHDATWRSRFGGTEYLYNGSHGCVGVTLSAAKKIFENVSVGTHVVIYGGMSKSQLPTKEPTITFAQSEYTIEVGQTLDLGITTNSDGKQWLSVTKAGIVTVLDKSTIRGDSVGTVGVGCYLDASSTYRSAHKDVVVHVVPAGSLAKEQNITVSLGTNSLKVGESTQFKVENYQNSPTFSSDNTNVATVDGSGRVNALNPGTANLTVTCPEGNGYKAASKTVTITVTEAPKVPVDQAISATARTYELMEGGSTQITVSGAEGRSLSFSASSDLVSVDASGKVTVVKAPEADTQVIITVSAAANADYNAASTTVTITVKPTPAPDPDPVEPSQPSQSGSARSGDEDGTGTSGENP